MKTTGRASEFDILDHEPEKPYLKDIKKDLKAINESFSPRVAKEIKKKLINEILNNI